jgi:ABC-2 type transport system ATP-binding protein
LLSAIDLLSRDGKTIIFSTHDMAAAESLCDGFVMLHRGKKVLDLSRSQLRDQTKERVIRVTTDTPLGETPIPGVERRLVKGHDSELILNPDTDPQSVLAEITSRHAVARFEITHPSLEDLFLRLAGTQPA